MRYIDSFREGMHISDVYLCKNRQIALTKNGKEYGNLVLQDKTGTIDAKIWDLGSPGVGNFETLDYVYIDADVTVFMGANQLNVKRIRKADEGEYIPADYLPVSLKDVKQMYSELLALIASVKNPYLRKLLDSYFGDPDFARAFQFHSAAKSVHHGFVGGLLDCMGLTGIRRERVLALLAQKNVPGIQAMAGQGELQRRDADDLVQLMEIYAPLKEGIAQAGALARNNASWEALRQLSVTASILESFGLNGQVRLDFSLVNSMDYYNGVIFQGFLPKIPFPVLSGGRYDNLPRKMGKEVGAIGFALYMGRLEQFFGQERQYDADVLLTYGPDADLVKLAAFAERLRQEGRSVRCERETGQPCPVRCRKKVRYTDGIGPEEVLA